jgi:hypothetical protein
LVWMFPTSGYGLIYDVVGSKWCDWRAWDDRDQPVSITSAYNWAEENVFLVGLSDGSIAQLDDTVATDMGSPIKVQLVSGFTSHGTTVQKSCNALMLQFKRTWSALPVQAYGINSDGPAYGLSPSGHIRVSKRDDNGSWTIVKDVELSSSAEPCLTVRSLGVYRTRQWKVEYTGADELQLVSAQEAYENLGA